MRSRTNSTAEAPRETDTQVAKPQTSVALPADITLKVGPEGRVFVLPRVPLVLHSTYFADLLSNSSTNLTSQTPLQLQILPHHPFADFADFIRSSIYSPNRLIPEYHSVRAHMDAALLGYRLVAKGYYDAAVRQLWAEVKGGWRPSVGGSNQYTQGGAGGADLRARDISAVLYSPHQTYSGGPLTFRSSLDTLVLDAVAASVPVQRIVEWSGARLSTFQFSVSSASLRPSSTYTGHNSPATFPLAPTSFSNHPAPTSQKQHSDPDQERETEWSALYSSNLIFRAAMHRRMHVLDGWRRTLVRSVKE